MIVPPLVMSVAVIGYCRDCKHWEQIELLREGRCLAAGEPGALAYPDGRYHDLITNPDFGCFMFEAK